MKNRTKERARGKKKKSQKRSGKTVPDKATKGSDFERLMIMGLAEVTKQVYNVGFTIAGDDIELQKKILAIQKQFSDEADADNDAAADKQSWPEAQPATNHTHAKKARPKKSAFDGTHDEEGHGDLRGRSNDEQESQQEDL
ncbi:unnamed protein product [Amoebophrya sp. A120]|nr:unnamed protein product [Amoebophrya sp. A120]|eukprot:GSA120T00026073001.1